MEVRAKIVLHILAPDKRFYLLHLNIHSTIYSVHTACSFQDFETWFLQQQQNIIFIYSRIGLCK